MKTKVKNPGISFLAVTLLAGILMQATSAQAVRFRLPLSSDTGVHYYYDHNTSSGVTAWNCSGTSYNGHGGSDFSGGPRGRAIFAAASGTLIYKIDGFGDGYAGSPAGGGAGNHVRIDHGGGVVTWYAHMTVGSVTGRSVGSGFACGEQVGGVGTSGSSTGLHLHFTVQVNGVNRDPYIGGCGGLGWWVNQGSGSPSTTCENTAPAAHEYIGVLYQDGLFAAKEGSYGAWYNQLGGVSAIQMNGNRFGALAGGGVYVKEGLFGGWTTQTPGGAAKFQLHGDRIAVLYNSGTLSAKDGLYGAWFDQLGGVTAFQLEGNHIGALAGGRLFVKEGLQGGWTTQTAPGVVRFQLSGDRIGALFSDGLFTCKDGLYGSWFNQLGGVTDFHLNGNRIGVVAGTAVYVKEGLQGGWTTQSPGGAAKLQLHGDRIAVLYNNGILSAKDGLYGSWFDQLGGVTAFQLDGNRIGALAGGVVSVKHGLQGGWVNQTAPTATAFQLTTGN